MSSRQLKKLRAQEEQKKAALEAQHTSSTAGTAGEDADLASSGTEEDEEAAIDTRPRAKNVFAAFASLGRDDNGTEEKDGEDDVDVHSESDDINQQQQQQEQAAKTAKAGRKKKKAKKKDKGGKAELAAESTAPGTTASPAEVVTSGGKSGKGGKNAKGAKNARSVKNAKSTKSAATEDDGLDEIDRALKELNMQKPKPPPLPSSQGTQGTHGQDQHGSGDSVRMRVDFHDLRVLNELRDVFGRNTIRAARADEATNNSTNGGGGGGPAQGERVEGNPGMVMVDLETFLRGTPAVVPGMGRRAGAMLAAAAASQRGMTDAIARRNPFIEFKDTWPRAPSGGLGMRQVTPAASAATAAAGAVVEYAFTHSPAYVQLDETFFSLVMMHNHHPLIQFLKQNPYHIASLIQVSRVAKQDQNAALAADLCERALFSFGRATLSSFRQKLGEGLARLSFRRPENRQFLLAGYYYIKSLIPRGTYRTALAWVRLFLGVMPDDDYGLMLWGHALAVRASEERWLLEVCGCGSGDDDKADDKAIPALRHNPMRAYIRQTLVVARLQLGDEAGARAALAAGLARLPWLYGALFQALNLDVPRAVWGVQPRDDAEALYTALYVQQARDLWESSPVTALLQEVASAASASMSASKKLAPDDIVSAPVPPLPPAEPVSASIARFAYLDGTPATMALVPGSMLHASPNYDFDPLPPPRALNVFSHVGQERPWIVAANEEAEAGAGAGAGAWGAGAWGGLLDRFIMPPGDGALDPGFGDEDDGVYSGEEDDDVDVDEHSGNVSQHADANDDAVPQSSHEQYARQRAGGMPGAWVEDVDDEEFS